MTFELFALYFIIVAQSFVISRQLILLNKKCNNSINKPIPKIVFKRKEENMALVYELLCNAPADSDVVERLLRVNVNGNDVSNKSYPSDTTNFGEFTFNQKDDVVFILVDVDDADNESEPAMVQFQALDTIPPRIPGGFKVSLLREVDDVTPTPEPVLETTTTEAPVTPNPGPSGV